MAEMCKRLVYSGLLTFKLPECLPHGQGRKRAVPYCTPFVISIHVEPDEREVELSAQQRWEGFEKLVPAMAGIRRKLSMATKAPVHFCWMFRADPQIERVYGR